MLKFKRPEVETETMDEHSRTPLQLLLEQRDKLLTDIEALRNKIGGLDIAIKLVSEASVPAVSETSVPAEASRPNRGTVSQTMIDLLRQSGEEGLKPRNVVEMAAYRGINLNRGSVYTLLNRMEHSGVVVHEDAYYKLKEFARESDRSERLPPSELSRLRNGH
jgi:hypothetical protein